MLSSTLLSLLSLASVALAAPATVDRTADSDVANRGGVYEPVIHKVTVGRRQVLVWACPVPPA